jgi:hypothetical protein
MMTTITTILAYTLSLGAICSLFYVACRLFSEYLAMRKLKPLKMPTPVEVPVVKNQTAPKKKAVYKNPAKKQPTIKQAAADAAKKAATKKQPTKQANKKTAVRKKPQTKV